MNVVKARSQKWGFPLNLLEFQRLASEGDHKKGGMSDIGEVFKPGSGCSHYAHLQTPETVRRCSK